MALNKTPVFVPLGVGLRLDTGALLLKPAQGTLALDNCYLAHTGEIYKRTGSTVISTSTVDGSTIPASWQLGTLKDGLVSFGYAGAAAAASYSEASSKWTSVSSDMRGAAAVSTMPVNDLVGSGGTQPFPSDLAYSGGYYLAAYKAGGTGFYDLIDAASGTKVVSFSIANVNYPRCVFVSGFAVGVYTNTTGQLKISTINLSTFAVTHTLINSIPQSGAPLEVIGTSGGGFAAAYMDGANVLRETLFTSGLVATDYTVKDAAAANVVPNLFRFAYVAHLSDAGTQRSIVSFDTTNGARAHFNLTTSGGNQQAATTATIDATATVTLINGAAAYTITTTPTDIQLVYQTAITGVNTTYVIQRLSGVNSTIATYREMILVSKAWKVNGDFFFLGCPTAHGVYVVLRSTFTTNPAPLARAYVGDAIATGNGYQPNVPTVNGDPRILVSIALSVEAVGSAITETQGIEILGLTYPSASTAPTVGRPVEALGSLFVPTGGQLAQYDGRSYGEVGFPYEPVITDALPVAGGSLEADSTYRYQAVYLRFDNNGNAWRSAPSAPVEALTTSVNKKVNLTIRALTVTGWNVEQTWVEIYRSQANESEELTLVARIQNDPTSTSVTYSDTSSDATIASALPLYTTGGIAEAQPLPPTSVALFAQNRMWIVDGNDPTRLWPSKQAIDGQGLRWNEDDVISLKEVSSTPITALAALDDKIIVFKSDRIYVVTGDGPDQAGVGFFNVNTVMVGIGTINPQSAVSYPDGVLFQSAKGYELLDRGLSLSSPIPGTTTIGQAIEDPHADLVIFGGIHLPAQAQVRLYSSAGTTLVWDYVHNAWSTYGSQPAATATVWHGLGAYWNQSNSAVYAENTSGYLEGVLAYALSVITPWLSFETIEGCERIYRFQGVGRTIGNHTIKVEAVWDGNLLLTPDVRSRAMVTTEGIWPWELRPTRQKISSLRLKIYEDPGSGTAGPAIQGVSLVVGVKVGLRKQTSNLRLT